MKKQFIKILILVFLLNLIPLNLKAITEDKINASVQIICPDDYGNLQSGSGTIIDPKGIILTNKHVVTDKNNAIIKICVIGFVGSIAQEPDFGTEDDPNWAEVKYYTTSEDMDAAILYLDNSSGTSYQYVNIWGSDSSKLKFGDRIEIIGYPSIGGSTITYTSGDFSGFGSSLDGSQNYIKTTTPIEYGNSGGSAYDPNEQFVGMPTLVISGELNSISYILSVNSIKNWLSDILGINYQQAIDEQQPTIQYVPTTLQGDITPPLMFLADKIIFHSNETNQDLGGNNIINDDSNITIRWSDAVDENGIDGYYIYFGTSRNTNLMSDGVYIKEKTYDKILDIAGIYFVMISARDKKGNISSPVITQYNYKVYPDWLINDPMKYLLISNRPTYYYIYDYSSGVKGKLLKEIRVNTNKVQNVQVPSNNVLIEWNGASNKDFITKQEVFFDKGKAWDRCGGPAWEIWQAWEEDPNNLNLTDEANTKQKIWYECMASSYAEVFNNSFSKINLEVNKFYNFEQNFYFTYDNHINELYNSSNPFILTATKKIYYKENNNAINKLNGQILLQVESHGEAWYVNPADGKRYYMKDGTTAYQMMRSFGLGITNADLVKIPQEGDKNIYSSFVSKLKGKILLQVQSHGEAWYVNPKTGYRHYMKDGAAAYNLMRYYSLGITNKDLEKIPIGEL